MNMAALAAAPILVQAHVFAALAAFVLGVVQLAAPKGTLPHRALGRLWVGLMTVTALTPFVFVWGCGFGGLGPIHILSIVTLVTLVGLVRAARSGNIPGHRSGVLWLFFAALIGAGAFTLLPGRLMHDVVLGTAMVSYECR